MIQAGAPVYVGQYIKLLKYLHDVEFAYIIPMDGNRYEDGIGIRYRFGYEKHIPDSIITSEIDTRKCSIFEMMCALALRCEEQIMSDPDVGDRTGKWFWDMIESLGLLDMTDDKFSEYRVKEVVDIFIRRKYSSTGEGGLFTVPYLPKSSEYDFRRIEIWDQMMHYLEFIDR